MTPGAWVTRRWCGAAAAALALVTLPPAAAAAQPVRPSPAPQLVKPSPAPHAGSVEVSGGVVFTGRMDLGARDAEETRNINTGSGPFALFSSASSVPAAPAAVVRAGVYLSRALAVEGGLQYGRARLVSALSGDAEQAPSLSAEETLTRYLIEGTVVVNLTPLSFGGGRGVPFLSGGGGYLRELHEENALIATGREYHAGAGVKFWMSRSAPHLGLRADVGVSMRSGGIDLTSTRRTLPTAAVSLVYLF